MGLTIFNSKGRVVLAIKDSIRILPGALEIGEFLGFVQATVRAPANEYIGLLPIKLKGRLICPGGTFKGFFFSDPLAA